MDPITALTDDNLLAPMLPGVHEGSWDAWLAIIKGLYALPMTTWDVKVWREVTGRPVPLKPSRSGYFLVGRRGGKTQAAAALTLYETAFRDWTGIASKGELIVGALVAADRRQAGQALRYLRGGIEASAMLRGMVVKDTSEGIELSNGTELAVMTASHRSIRGRSFACLVADELCHWRTDGESPDAEILRAAEPALSLTDGLMLGISTPHARQGVMYSRWKRHYRKADAPALVVQAPSRRLNPRLPQSVVDEAMAEDEPSARAEYYSTWRDDVASYVSRDVLEALVTPGITERPPHPAHRFRAFVDVSSGRSDAFCWAVAHTEDGTDIFDRLGEIKPPFSPADAVERCAADLRRYGITEVRGDQYGAGWVLEQFEAAGLKYLPSELNRSEIYLDALPRLTAKRAELLDSDTLLNQLANLERRSRSGGRDSVDHPRGGNDDAANAAMGALTGRLKAQRKSNAAILLPRRHRERYARA
ncbi:hypothetical protein BWR19_17090 [Halomonas sp. 1513]|nr:hypothetical protein BWR19_17090 [Halomonas sp. 1513]